MHDTETQNQPVPTVRSRRLRVTALTVASVVLLLFWLLGGWGGPALSVLASRFGVASSTSSHGVSVSMAVAGQPTQGVPFTLLLSVYNPEAAPIMVSSIDFTPLKVNEVAIQSVTPATPMTTSPRLVSLAPTGPIPADGSALYRVTLVYPAAGEYTLTCTITQNPAPPMPPVPINVPFSIFVAEPPPPGP